MQRQKGNSIWLVLIFIVALFVVINMAGKSNGPTDNPAITQALAALKKEPKIKDVAQDGYTVWVGMINDKTSRNGYMQYVCQVLAEHNVTSIRRAVAIDIGAWVNNKKRVEMGQAHCR